MKYSTGQPVSLGDRVQLGNDSGGVVVGVIDDGLFSPDFPANEWAYLKSGVLIKFPSYGVIHYERELEPDVILVKRG